MDAQTRAWSLGNFYFERYEFEKALHHHKRHLQIAKDIGDKYNEGRAYGNVGTVFKMLGDFPQAIKNLELSLKIAKELGDKATEGNACCNLGDAFRRQGDFKKAEEYQRLYLEISKQRGDRIGEGEAYGNLGHVFLFRGNFREAKDLFDLQLDIATKEGNKTIEGRAYCNLGTAFRSLGDLKKAEYYYQRCLTIAKGIGDKATEGKSYGSLGEVFNGRGDFEKAIDYFNLALKSAKEVGNKADEGNVYGSLANAFTSLGKFETAIDNGNRCLTIAQKVGDKAEEGRAYGILGDAFQRTGNYYKAIENLELCLNIAKAVEDKDMEGKAYTNLGDVFRNLHEFKKAKKYMLSGLEIAKKVKNKVLEGYAYGSLGNICAARDDFEQAIEYSKLHIEIVKEVGDKAAEGTAYGNLGYIFRRSGNLEKAIDYFNLRLQIAKEVKNKAREINAHGNLSLCFEALGKFEAAIHHVKLQLSISKETGKKEEEAAGYENLGFCFESMGCLPEAVDHYKRSVTLFNQLRHLQSKDELKISLRDKASHAYTGYCRVLLKQGKVDEALFAAEEGRAQALTDLMKSLFGIPVGSQPLSHAVGKDEIVQILRSITSSIVFQAVADDGINLWLLSKERVHHRRPNECLREKTIANAWFQSLIENAFKQIGVRSGIKCEDRSLDALRENHYKVGDEKPDERKIPLKLQSNEQSGHPVIQQKSSLSILYRILIHPAAKLVQGNELILVPDGPLWLVPYPALVDEDSRYLCDSLRIRLIPSLTSLKLISDCPNEYHSRRGALLVGDPWVEEVTNEKGEKLLEQLEFAKQEVEMIGQILGVKPLTGKKATKSEVLKGLSSVALVHIAAHGDMETGEIALNPDPKRRSRIPTKEDYILTIADVLNIKLRARLVVLSCCHSGRGEIKAEGVVGIARAFMGAGARSVLVSLWAIDDEATLEFMKSFYYHLVEGRRASESLNLAMKCLRESDKYSDVKYWAPFALIGDDVTIDLTERNDTS